MANGIRRKDAVGMQELVSQYIREMKIASGINRQRVMIKVWSIAASALPWYAISFISRGMSLFRR